MENENKYKCFYCNTVYDKPEDVWLCQLKHEKLIKKNNTESLNHYILGSMLNLNDISDGQTTFGELYEDKYNLILALFVLAKERGFKIWYSDFFSDGSLRPGFFLAGLNEDPDDQITYLLPVRMKRYIEPLGKLLSVAPPFKAHNAEDVRERLLKQFVKLGEKE